MRRGEPDPSSLRKISMEFRRRLREVVERGLRQCLPVVRDLEWKRRWNPQTKKGKTKKKAYRELASWREAPGRLEVEDLPKKLLGPLVWLGTQTLERTAPQDRPRMAEEFVHLVSARSGLAKVSIPPKSERWWLEFDQHSGEPSSSSHPAVVAKIYRPRGFLERELARLNSHGFPRDLRSSLKQLPVLCRAQQGWFDERLDKRLQAAIRKMFQPPVNTIRSDVDADAARMTPPEASAPSRDGGAAEPGAPMPVPIPQPGADVALEIVPGVNMPTAEVHASTSPTLDLLNRIHQQSSWNEVADRVLVDGVPVDRSTLLAWRDTQMGKLPKRRVSSRMAQKIADGFRHVAIELKILPPT
jgi:hypothetical protein